VPLVCGSVRSLLAVIKLKFHKRIEHEVVSPTATFALIFHFGFPTCSSPARLMLCFFALYNADESEQFFSQLPAK
jgi:hypothetical protein